MSSSQENLLAAGAARSEWWTPFEPLPFFRGGHVQTLAGNYWRRAAFTIPFSDEIIPVDPTDGTRILCHCHWQPEAVRAERLTILLLHGLEGSSDSQYIQGITMRAWSAGCNVIRMNMRNCGGTEAWTPTLYHSGLSGDVAAVLEHCVRRYQLRRVAMAGYSMGGNLMLKLAGEYVDRAPDWLVAAVAVSPAADLAATADALHEPGNRIYERHFLRNLMRRFHGKERLFPQIYSAKSVGPVRTIREFDELITARYCDFAGADEYYYRSSAARVVADIRVPTLVIHALDDPFIRMLPETRELLFGNPAVELVETPHGGHCAFLAKAASPQTIPGDKQRHWAEATLVRYLLAAAGQAYGG